MAAAGKMTASADKLAGTTLVAGADTVFAPVDMRVDTKLVAGADRLAGTMLVEADRSAFVADKPVAEDNRAVQRVDSTVGPAAGSRAALQADSTPVVVDNIPAAGILAPVHIRLAADNMALPAHNMLVPERTH